MANVKKVNPAVKIELGGVEREFTLDFGVLCRIEELTGKNALTGELFQKMSANILVIILYAGLSENDPSLTRESVGKLLNFSDIPRVTEAIGAALKQAQADNDTGSAQKK